MLISIHAIVVWVVILLKQSFTIPTRFALIIINLTRENGHDSLPRGMLGLLLILFVEGLEEVGLRKQTPESTKPSISHRKTRQNPQNIP